VIDEAEVGQVWEVSSSHYVAGMPRRSTTYLVLEHTDENVIADPSGAWILLDLETGEIRLRTRLYSDFGWQRIL
jgi:hypothetical protein